MLADDVAAVVEEVDIDIAFTCSVCPCTGGGAGISVRRHVGAQVAVAFSLAGAQGGPVDSGCCAKSFAWPFTSRISRHRVAQGYCKEGSQAG